MFSLVIVYFKKYIVQSLLFCAHLKKKGLWNFFWGGSQFSLDLAFKCHVPSFSPFPVPIFSGWDNSRSGRQGEEERKAPGVSWEKVSSFFGKEKYSGVKGLS